MKSANTRHLNCPHNLSWFNQERCVGKYQMPVIRQENFVPERLIDFNSMMKSKDFVSCIHFYLDDYRFERFWKEPERYLPRIKHFAGACSPDFSLYSDMPLAMMIWNTYRSRLLGQIMQDAGIKVIPTVSWAGSESYDFCFDGLPRNSMVTVSTVGVMQSKESRKLFERGFNAMLEVAQPKKILFYGKLPKIIFDKVEVFSYENTSFEWRNRKYNVDYEESNNGWKR